MHAAQPSCSHPQLPPCLTTLTPKRHSPGGGDTHAQCGFQASVSLGAVDARPSSAPRTQELAPLTELAKVALPDVILCGHVDLIVGADEDECCEIRRVHVRVGESQKATVGGFGLHRAQGSRP